MISDNSKINKVETELNHLLSTLSVVLEENTALEKLMAELKK